MCRRPLPTAAVQLLLFCFFSALLLFLPSQGNALTCGLVQRTESKVEAETHQQECRSHQIVCYMASCSADLGPSDFPSSITTKGPPVPSTTTTTTTTTTTKRSRTTKSDGGKKSGGGRLIVKPHLVFSLQMIIGFVPAMFVGLNGSTA
uniref:Uncharacterized protein n=1 Tax=Globodera rostochiensis TaxID=31243 RepID=A0A914I647_GLORO